MKRLFGILLMLLVLGVLCGVATAADKCCDPTDIAPSLVMAEMTGDAVVDVVLVALGTEQPLGHVSGSAVLKEDLMSVEKKGIGPLVSVSGLSFEKTFIRTQPSASVNYLPDIGDVV